MPIAFAPGRVNLIGEHTDYNDGFVLPMAIEPGVRVTFSARADPVIRAHAVAFRETREARLDALRAQRGTATGWFKYVAGVAWALGEAGIPVRGADLSIDADLPVGAGLSSSAALEIGVALALVTLAGQVWDPRAVAVAALRAEREFAGLECGIMDQLAVAAARQGSALLIDCRSLDTRDVPVPADVRLVVFDTGVHRELTAGQYNERRASCAEAVEAIRTIAPHVAALRDVDEQLLAAARPLMDPVAFRRASHVVAENLRPASFAIALDRHDLDAAGHLMLASHASLRDLYEVSCAELDLLVELATGEEGCHGARMTGAGFGGCAIALVEAQAAERVRRTVSDAYRQRTGREGHAFVSNPSAGARLIG